MSLGAQDEFGRQPLVATKLVPPPTPGSLLARPRLTALLTHALARRVVLISAPAGSGKTTLLADWRADHPEMARRVAWVSLDASDNDPMRLMEYMVAAIRTVDAHVGEALDPTLRAGSMSGPEVLLAPFLNNLAQLPHDCYLALDDYAVIRSPAVHESLSWLIQRAPSRFHIVILSRSVPPLPLARLRALGELGELRASDLRFTLEEAGALLTHVMQLPLPPEDVARLHAQTEGWITGLHLVGMSLRGQEGAVSPPSAWAGRHVHDYLAEEVLQRQPEEVRRFLLRTSILRRLCAPLCDAVHGTGGSQALLERLEQENAFVVSLDDERRWYRYHPIFTEMLLHQLSQEAPDETAALHKRARVWFEEAGSHEDAIHHALAARDYDEAARLISWNAMPTLLRGKISTTRGWLDALPDHKVRSSATLSAAYAWAHLLATDLDGIEVRLRDTGRLLSARNPTQVPSTAGGVRAQGAYAPGRRELRGGVEAIRAYIALLHDDTEHSIVLAQRALGHLPKRDLTFRGAAASILGDAYARGDNALAANETYREAIRISERAGDLISLLLVLKDYGWLQIAQGQLRAAEGTFRRALQLSAQEAGQETPYAGFAHSGLGEVLYERNDLEAAEKHLVHGIQLCESGGFGERAIRGTLVLARLAVARGTFDKRDQALEQATRLARGTGLESDITLVAAHAARLQAESGDIDAALSWADASGLLLDRPNFAQEPGYLALALVKLLAAQGFGDREGTKTGLAILQALRALAERGGRAGSAIGLLAAEAVAQRTLGDTSEALETLEHALTLGQPEQYIRTFLDLGRPMAALLALCRRRLVAPLWSYADRLLLAFPVRKDSGPAPERREDLIEPLSARELQVLRLASAGLSNQQIADELGISMGTIKVHLRNVYGKLNAERRVEAIVRARELGIL